MSMGKKKTTIIFILALVVLYIVIYVVPTVSGAMVSSYTAEYGQLKIFDDTTAYFVRSEDVYVADTSGDTNYFFEEGSLVRKGGRIMEIAPDGASAVDEEGNPLAMSGEFEGILTRLDGEESLQTDYKIKDVGVVSYFADGYEKVLTPKTMTERDEAFFKQLSQDDVAVLKRDYVIEGEPVFKIVDRTEWFMVCFVDKEHADRYEEGNRVKVEFEDDTVSTRVYKVQEFGQRVKIILRTDYYYEKFAELRTAEVSLVTYDGNGVIIENSSIAEEKGEEGVYVKGKNDEFFFVPIQIYASDGKRSLIADDFYYDLEKDGEMVITVEVYDEILKDAKNGKGSR